MRPFTIAVAGKGGTGKTTLAALIVDRLRRVGPVLAVDADPNCNLGEVLGIPVERTLGQLRDEILENLSDLPPGVPKDQILELGLHECLVEDEGVDLLTMGHGEGPRCYCMVNHVLRRAIETLRGNYRYVVLDNEAGMEHLSRRTTQDVDVLLVVAEPNPVSLRSAARIRGVAEELKLRVYGQYLVLNRTGEETLQGLEGLIREVDIPLLGTVPYDPGVAELSAAGRPLRELPPDSPARRAVEGILERLGLGKEG
jgi:CO dehydrogenase maturation factor